MLPPSAPAPTGTPRDLGLGACAALLAALVYAGTLANGLVWDDAVVIAGNAALRGDPFQLIFATDVGRAIEPTPYYRPLTLLTFLVEERLHGLAPTWMHLVNVLLHAGCTFLVHRLARALIADRAGALLVALLFAVHPLQGEAVSFLSGGRNTLLATLLGLGALLLHRRSVAAGTLAPAAALCLLAASLSKETALLVVPFLVMAEVVRDEGGRLRLRPRAALRLAPYGAALAVYAALRQAALAGAGVSLQVDGLGARLLADLYVLPAHLASAVWPRAIVLAGEVPGDLGAHALSLAAAWLAIAVAVAWLLGPGRSPATLFGLAWFAAFWLPVSGIVAIPSSPIADRHLYLPAIGLWIVVGDQAARRFPTGAPARRLAEATAIVLLVVLGGLSVDRTAAWKSDVTLFARFVADHPDRAFGHHNLGCAYLDVAKDLDAAEREFRAALALDPAFPRLQTQLGYVRLVRGDFDGALGHYDAALALYPLDAEALLNRAMIRDLRGRRVEAALDYQRFLATPATELPAARPGAAARLRDLLR